jgi:hypothetical protein
MRSVASTTCHNLSSQHAAVPNLRHYIVSSWATTSSHLYPHVFPLLTLMFVLEEPKSKKRRRSSTHSEDLESQPTAKKQKSASESRSQPRHRPLSFWNTLSKVWLTRGALKEFDRRNIEEKVQPPCTLTPKVEYPTGRARLRLKRFAQRGGPDLSHLRGVRLYVCPIEIMVC